MIPSLIEKAVQARNVIGVCILGAGLVTGVASLVKMPGVLEAHVHKADSMIVAQHETNRLLRQSLCILAKSDSPAGCLLKP